jgi:hypothetical protein
VSAAPFAFGAGGGAAAPFAAPAAAAPFAFGGGAAAAPAPGGFVNPFGSSSLFGASAAALPAAAPANPFAASFASGPALGGGSGSGSGLFAFGASAPPAPPQQQQQQLNPFGSLPISSSGAALPAGSDSTAGGTEGQKARRILKAKRRR